MTRVLVLGGTGWLGSRIAQRWLDEGASVTCLARGGRSAPAGARLVVANRDRADAYDGVRTEAWDEAVDLSSTARHVRTAGAALTGAVGHTTLVSSVSVYADADTQGADEDAPLVPSAAPDDDADYARQKAAAEGAVRAAFGHRAAIVRPGLIAGPGDPTDRFGYWVARFAAAGAEPVLVPDAPQAAVQVIDVDDLAAFVVNVGRAAFAGTVNAVGDPMPLVDVLASAREVAGHTGAVVPVPPDVLRAQDIGYWAGPRSLPLWLPDDMPGFATRSNARYRRLGGRLRPLIDTLDRTLADERARGLDRPRAAGLTRAEERAVLAARRPGGNPRSGGSRAPDPTS